MNIELKFKQIALDAYFAGMQSGSMMNLPVDEIAKGIPDPESIRGKPLESFEDWWKKYKESISGINEDWSIFYR